MGSLYELLRESVRSEYGLFREPVPNRPKKCDFARPEDHRKAMERWDRKVCSLERWEHDEQLDQYLMSKDQELVAQEVTANGIE